MERLSIEDLRIETVIGILTGSAGYATSWRSTGEIAYDNRGLAASDEIVDTPAAAAE